MTASLPTVPAVNPDATLEELLELKVEAAANFDKAVAAYKAHTHEHTGEPHNPTTELDSECLAMEVHYRKGVLARAAARFLAATLAD